jgi:hypothetical protein
LHQYPAAISDRLAVAARGIVESKPAQEIHKQKLNQSNT